MTAIEQLIKIKLGAALNNEKRRVAESLLDTAVGPNKSDGMKARTEKTQKISDMKKKLSELSAQAHKAKDPVAMKQKIDAMKQKIGFMQQDLTLMK